MQQIAACDARFFIMINLQSILNHCQLLNKILIINTIIFKFKYLLYHTANAFICS